jgi:hypothetical protein
MTKENNQNATKYGGEGAIKRISSGKPFIGMAKDEQKAVETELQEKGLEEIVKVDAIRLQSVLNMYFFAIEKAAIDGDLESFDRFVARFGWLSGVALRAWDQVKQQQKDAGKGKVSIVDVLDAFKDNPTTPQNAPGESE